MDLEIRQKFMGRLDTLGACLSLACAVHCVLLPFVLTVLPLLGLTLFGDHRFEIFMIIGAVSIATFNLCWGSRVHGNQRIFWFIPASLLFFGGGVALLEDPRHGFLLACGGVLLATGHILNRKLCKSCHRCSA